MTWVKKTELYAAVGIVDYWIVNLQEFLVVVHVVHRQPENGRYSNVK